MKRIQRCDTVRAIMRPFPSYLFGLAAFLGCNATPVPATPRASAQSPVLGETISLTLPTDRGGLVTIPLEGARATVVDFFSPACEPCRISVPELLARDGAVRARGGRVVLVAVLSDGESTEAARLALGSWGVRASFLVDREGASRRDLGVSALPATLVLDPSGKVRWVAPPGASADEIVSAVSSK